MDSRFIVPKSADLGIPIISFQDRGLTHIPPQGQKATGVWFDKSISVTFFHCCTDHNAGMDYNASKIVIMPASFACTYAGG
jgi:hypothetical protein